MLFMLPSSPVPDPPPNKLYRCTKLRFGPLSGCEKLSLANSYAVSFSLIPMCLGTIPFGFCYVLSFVPGIDGSRRLIWNLSGSCQGP